MATQSQKPQMHSLMRLQEYGGMVVLQPQGEHGTTGQSLTCDLQTGKLTLADAVDKMGKGYTDIYGVMGIAKLQTGCVLVAVTGARKVNLPHALSSLWLLTIQARNEAVSLVGSMPYCTLLCSSASSLRYGLCIGAGCHVEGLSSLPSKRHQALWQTPLE